MRIALISPLRTQLREPLAGGLEVFCVGLGRVLRSMGHEVEVFGGCGSDPALGVSAVEALPLPARGRLDISQDPVLVAAELGAYERLLESIGARDFDVIHDNSLHHLPIIWARSLRAEIVTTFHTPPIERVARAVRADQSRPQNFVAVSHYTAASWAQVAGPSTVIPNGVDLDRWPFGEGGRTLVWSGRLVEEKGVTFAIRAARLAGHGLLIAGRRQDPAYFNHQVRPLLGGGIEYVGHLTQPELSALVRASSAAMITPCWDEPYGLVVAEALASGTPVVGFARGGLGEVVNDVSGVLVRPGDVTALAQAIDRSRRLDRRLVRQHAETSCSLRQTARRYEAVFERLLRRSSDTPLVLDEAVG